MSVRITFQRHRMADNILFPLIPLRPSLLFRTFPRPVPLSIVEADRMNDSDCDRDCDKDCDSERLSSVLVVVVVVV